MQENFMRSRNNSSANRWVHLGKNMVWLGVSFEGAPVLPWMITVVPAKFESVFLLILFKKLECLVQLRRAWLHPQLRAEPMRGGQSFGLFFVG